MGIFEEKTVKEELQEAKTRLKQLENDPLFYNTYTDNNIRQLDNSIE